jgi:hypothetical protein
VLGNIGFQCHVLLKDVIFFSLKVLWFFIIREEVTYLGIYPPSNRTSCALAIISCSNLRVRDSERIAFVWDAYVLKNGSLLYNSISVFEESKQKNACYKIQHTHHTHNTHTYTHIHTHNSSHFMISPFKVWKSLRFQFQNHKNF